MSTLPRLNTPLIESIIKKLFRNVLFGPDNYKAALVSRYLFTDDIAIRVESLDFLKDILTPIIDTQELDEEDLERLAKWWYNSNEIVFDPNLDPTFTFVDLFAGIGGFRLAMQEQGGACVFSSEWNKDSQKTYFTNFGEIPFGDITRADTKSFIPDHFDVLCAGFPCQPFSKAGVSSRTSLGLKHGFEHPTQGTLFFDIVDIARRHRPRALFLENVKNLKSHDKGNTFKVIEKSLRDIGYSFFSEVISSEKVVPQKRERTYMVCFLDENIQFEFPVIEGDALPLKLVLEPDVSDKYTISDKLWEGHKRRTKKNVERGTGFTAYVADINKPSKTIVARYGKDGKECLVPQEGKNPRMLTPRECARLMGFPEEYKLPDSASIAYKQFGNSVAVPVISAISRKIVEALEII